jgi:hypothetical protein
VPHTASAAAAAEFNFTLMMLWCWVNDVAFGSWAPALIAAIQKNKVSAKFASTACLVWGAAGRHQPACAYALSPRFKSQGLFYGMGQPLLLHSLSSRLMGDGMH